MRPQTGFYNVRILVCFMMSDLGIVHKKEAETALQCPSLVLFLPQQVIVFQIVPPVYLLVCVPFHRGHGVLCRDSVWHIIVYVG